MIRHILLIKFKDQATELEISELKALFEAIRNKIEGIVAVEWGVNDSLKEKIKAIPTVF
ncbi:stress responsive alpha-beta barrel domain protein dabb [Vibrio ishigakensis]|uniref:Stress responsive alpha-beta barrel domain protein dabb n=1 Tax=Vibrio ishigakensis TaxID=1481914 RepID=A0A0B8P262_9VIBR|nr:stress responsive alpha-beta barrel domain protein dabb [Vibrio ishigakensis]